jgi:hypothetical protein
MIEDMKNIINNKVTFLFTISLAPHGKKGEKKGYFIMNDIVHITTHNSCSWERQTLFLPPDN